GSAGANPGPACYDRGGSEPTVTDANLILGLMGEDALLGNKIRLDRQKAEKAIKEKICYPFDWSIEEGAWAINRIVSDNISNEIRKITLSQGINPGSLKMVAYGGAGPMHAADICRDLGIANAVIPANPGVFSATGLFSCNKTMDFVTAYSKYGKAGLEKAIKELRIKGRRWFGKENIPKSSQKMAFSADMRYRGQNYEINVPIPSLNMGNDIIWNNLAESFNKKHLQVYGHFKKGVAMEVVNIRLKCIGRSKIKVKPNFMPKGKGAPVKDHRDIMFLNSRERIRAPIYDKMRMDAGRKIKGPAVIEQVDSTIVIPPGDSAVMEKDGGLVINIFKGQNG
ncbi:MAG: hydantoinase/oxoprolinase family protein, partial [Candidatus Humimicrobiaceae bacterium]